MAVSCEDCRYWREKKSLFFHSKTCSSCLSPEHSKAKCTYQYHPLFESYVQLSSSAIVTGASRGIGEAIAFDLASRGAKVAITYSSDRSKKTADELIARMKSEAKTTGIGIQCDLKEIDAPKQIVDETIKAFGKDIDILVNNAAIISDKMIADITPEHFDEVFQ